MDYLARIMPDGHLRFSPDYLWSADPDRYVDEFIAGDDWVLPYHATVLCATGACPPVTATRKRMLLMPVDAVVNRNVPFTKRITGAFPITLPAAGVYNWDNSWLTLAFEPGGRLDVNSPYFNVSGMTFTAADAAAGWGGVRFNAGSGGAWTGATVERVAGSLTSSFGPILPTHAVTVTDATPTFTNVTVQDPAAGTGPVDGFYVSRTTASQGPLDAVVITAPIIQRMSGRGVVGNAGARVEVVRGTITGSGQAAVVAGGTNANVYLVPAYDGPDFRGPTITGNPGGGVSAASAGAVRFGPPAAADGFVTVSGNGGRGMTATGGGVVYAGTGGYYRKNAIFLNQTSNTATGNGFATGTSSRVYARCDWWNQEVTPFRTGAASGGLVDVSGALAQNPIGNPAVTCPGGVGGGDTGGRSAGVWTTRGGTAGRDGATALDRLAEAMDAPTATDAVALLGALIADEPASAEAGAAVAEVGGIAGRADAPASAAALLIDLTGSGYGTLRVAAWQALVSARRATGDLSGAFAAADALAAEGGPAAVQAELARVYLHTEAADSTAALASLAALEALAGSEVEVGLAWSFLGLPGGEAPAGGQAAGTAADVGKASGAAPDDTATLAVGPNPASSGATVTVTLTEASEVTVTVYDLLGRAVATVLQGALVAGTHEAGVDVSALAPGVYIVRASVNTAAGTVVQSARLTVAR